DLGTLRRIPWHEATVMVQCDVEWHDGRPVAPSPRQVLKAQVEKARALGYEPRFGSELEFFLFRETYAEAHARHYHDLTPSVPYILDYHILAASFDEPLLREVRTSMKAAGMVVESSKGEAWAGQHEINFRFRDALRTADDHVVYKTGLKEVAHQRGCSVTFMAKPHHDWVGSSCHIHSSLWRDGENAFAGETELFGHYLAGQIACLGDLAIFVAPVVNSYKRFAAGSWAPKIGRASCRERVDIAGGAGSSRRRHTRWPRDWSSDVCSSDLGRLLVPHPLLTLARRGERVRRRDRALRPLPRRADRVPGRPRDLRRAGRQLVQALRGGKLGS